MPTQCGFVTIIGRPSAGKSTLLNAFCHEYVAITSAVPQTTRNLIRGMVNRPEGQLIFLDTPGFHKSDKKLNLYLRKLVYRSLKLADLILYLIDASRPPGKEEQALVELLQKSQKPLVVAMNKIDLKTPHLQEFRAWVKIHLNPEALLEISATQEKNLEALIAALMALAPQGPPHYSDEFYTDQETEFRLSEIIRAQALSRVTEELPHALYVEIADMEFQEAEDKNKRESTGKKMERADPLISSPSFSDDPKGRDLLPKKTLWIRAFLVVERSSQVGILVGHKGVKIRAIRLASVQDMKKIFPWRLDLDLRVKINSKWRKKDPLLKKMLGFSE